MAPFRTHRESHPAMVALCPQRGWRCNCSPPYCSMGDEGFKLDTTWSEILHVSCSEICRGAKVLRMGQSSRGRVACRSLLGIALSFCAVRRVSFCVAPWTQRGGCTGSALPRCVRKAKYATVTPEGQDSWGAQRQLNHGDSTPSGVGRAAADGFGALREAVLRQLPGLQPRAVLAKGRDGPVVGLRDWLKKLDLEDYAYQAMMWAEEMGACDLDAGTWLSSDLQP
eukprot:s878_g14.t1